MKCPNPKCSCKKFLPADANFCPECGTQLRPGKVVFIPDNPNISSNATSSNSSNSITRKCEINFCTAYPGTIKPGEKAALRWAGNNVNIIRVDGKDYSSEAKIYLSPTTSKEYKVDFISNSGEICTKCVQVLVSNGLLWEGKGKLMKDGSFKIDLRQVTPPSQAGWGVQAYPLAVSRFKWDIVTGERNIKAYVAEDEKLEFVMDKSGRLLEINFYPDGKFKTDDIDEAYSSIMKIPFGQAKRIKEGWWKNEEYYVDVHFPAQYAQYGVENMTAEQWWKEHDLTCLNYLTKYQEVIKKHMGVDILKERIWEKGEWRYYKTAPGGMGFIERY
jgi:hypothetical protein